MVDELGDKLRVALQNGRFDAALPLIDDYGQAVRRALRAAHDDREREKILSEASSFLQDRLHLARVLRSHLSAQAGANSRQISYENPSSTKSTWKFDA